jgi:hypothetical protein
MSYNRTTVRRDSGKTVASAGNRLDWALADKKIVSWKWSWRPKKVDCRRTAALWSILAQEKIGLRPMTRTPNGTVAGRHAERKLPD